MCVCHDVTSYSLCCPAGVVDGVLKVSEMDFGDGGEYKCSANNMQAGVPSSYNATITIRVKGQSSRQWARSSPDVIIVYTFFQ